MKRWILPLVSSLILFACNVFTRTPEGDLQVDFTALADQVSLARQDVADLAPAASPELQTKLAALDESIAKVEGALRTAGAGGPISDVRQAAEAALDVADQVLADVDPQSDTRFYVGLARIALRHLAAADFERAEQELSKEPQPTTP